MKKPVLLLVLIFAAAFAGQYDLLVCHCDPGSTSGVQTNIGGDPYYDSVDMVDCTSQTPTVATMQNYGCVYTWSNYQYQNATQMGNNLADYVDAGGTVVINDFSWTAGWGLQGRLMTDANYAPMTHNGSGAYTYTNLGSKDDAHVFMDGVSSISNIFFWTYVSKEAPATWVADNTNGTIYCAVNADFNVAGVNMYPGDYRYWSGDGWVLYNNIIQNLMEGQWYPGEGPYVTGMDPDDGDSGVPVETDIVFHCVDDLSAVDTDTIVFTVEDQSLGMAGAVLHSCASLPALQVGRRPTGEITGTLDIDDSDPRDVLCTFDPDSDLPVDLIKCTVDGDLADSRGNPMGDDFVWTFNTGNYGVEQTTWGAIKAGF